MTEDLRNSMRGEAERAQGRFSQTRFGIIDGVNPDLHTARVRFQPEDTLSGWIPVAALSVGAGWGLHALPAVGAQVVVSFQEGSPEGGIITGAVYSQRNPPAGGVPVGAIWLTSSGGAKVKLNPDGSVDILSEVEIRLGAAAGPFLKLVKQTFMALYNGHTHGGGPTPTQQMVEATHLTTNTKAT